MGNSQMYIIIGNINMRNYVYKTEIQHNIYAYNIIPIYKNETIF